MSPRRPSNRPCQPCCFSIGRCWVPNSRGLSRFPLAPGAWCYLVVFGSLAASYAYVNPVIALLLGVTFGGEAITAGEWGVAGVVLCGVLLLLWRPAARA